MNKTQIASLLAGVLWLVSVTFLLVTDRLSADKWAAVTTTTILVFLLLDRLIRGTKPAGLVSAEHVITRSAK